jgi:hypothetical protein
VNDATLEKETSKPAPFVGYSRLLVEVHVAVRTTVPRGRTVLVVSRGDEQFVRLEGRRGWHFPRHEDGRWAGFHPADAQEAVEHLESLRLQGAQYLVFPETAFWWLDYYGGLKEHLETRYKLLASSETCHIYDIRAGRAASAGAAQGEAPGVSPRIGEIVQRLLPPDAETEILTLDASASDDLAQMVELGIRFLVVPRSASGWVMPRPQLERQLREHHRLVMLQEHLCEIYELSHG